MRVYFEKPRTTVGWKGLINDPHLDGSFAINEGLRVARGLLLDLAQLGVAAGLRVPRHDHAAVHRRPGELGRHRRAHHREPGPPRAGLGAVDAGRLQERHRRQRRRSRSTRSAPPATRTSSCRSPSRACRPSWPRAATTRCHVILRGGNSRPELRRRARRRHARVLAARPAPAAPDGRLQPRQQQQGPPRQPAVVARAIGDQIARRRAARLRRHAREPPGRRPPGLQAGPARSPTGRASPTPASAGTTRCRCSRSWPRRSAPAAAKPAAHMTRPGRHPPRRPAARRPRRVARRRGSAGWQGATGSAS